VYCAVAVPYRSDYVAVTADPSLEAVLFDFSHTLFRPEERTQWVQRAAELAGATLAEEEATRLAGEIERLLVADQDAERQVGRDLSPQAHRAAIGGIMAASRLLAVNQNSGGSELLLLAIAGPVIAGTSLFGGRGSVWTALLGALVIGSISNGMDLLALSSAVKFMVTGGVLLLAVIVDAIARQQRQATGRV